MVLIKHNLNYDNNNIIECFNVLSMLSDTINDGGDLSFVIL